jgi:hypothetical protein
MSVGLSDIKSTLHGCNYECIEVMIRCYRETLFVNGNISFDAVFKSQLSIKN